MLQSTGRESPATYLLLGLALTVVLHGLHCPMAVVAGAVSCAIEHMSEYCAIAVVVPFVFIGVSQLIYRLPAIGPAFWKWNKAVGIGLAIGALITLLLNGVYLAVTALG